MIEPKPRKKKKIVLSNKLYNIDKYQLYAFRRKTNNVNPNINKNVNKNINKNVSNKKVNNKVNKPIVKNANDKPIDLLLNIFVIVTSTLIFYFITKSVYGTNFSLIFSFILLVFILIGVYLDNRNPNKKHRLLKALCIIVLLFMVAGLIGGVMFFSYIAKNAPKFDPSLLNMKESSIIYDSKKNEIAKLGTELRDNIEYEQVSETFIDALVATEDSRFFTHDGFDLPRFFKAAVGQVMNKITGSSSNAGGGSTLSMQVVKNTFTSSEDTGIKGIVRKFTDIYISVYELERNYTKEQIIEFYINNHSIYGITYGIQEGSRALFGKDAEDLNLAEASLAVGLYQSPSTYNPFTHPEAAEKRRNTVLYQMHNHGYITEEEWNIAKSIPVTSLLAEDDNTANPYQGYIDYVCEEVQNRYQIDPLKTPVLIYTNLDTKIQDGINSIFNNKSTELWGKNHNYLQAGTAVINSHNGAILALGTGRNKTGAKTYSYATFSPTTLRQIGSTAKPLFDYGPGMEYNNWSTYTLFDDSPYTYTSGQSITNWDNGYKGIITLRRALADSRNVPALKAFQQVDKKKIIKFVTSAGITPEISGGTIHEAHSIGSFTGASPLIMAGAYQIFSNGGYYYEPYSVHTIQLRETKKNVIQNFEPTKVKVASESTAYMITDVLRGVGTNRSGLENDDVAVKTGTTNVSSEIKKKYPDAIRDLWIDGYTPDTVISLWIGYDSVSVKGEWLKSSGGSNLRNTIFNRIARVAFKHDGQRFVQPDTVTKVTVVKNSDPPVLPNVGTDSNNTVTELFKVGTEPTEISIADAKTDPPSNVKANLQANGDVIVSWDPITAPTYLPGTFGYYVSYNGQSLGFTINASYTISNGKEGTYKVKTGYQVRDAAGNIRDHYLSDEVSAELKYQYLVYPDQALTGSVEVLVGNPLPDHVLNKDLITLKQAVVDKEIDKKDYKINFIITNTDTNSKVTNIDTSKAGNYLVKYHVIYQVNGVVLYEQTLPKPNQITVTVKEKEPEKPEEPGEPEQEETGEGTSENPEN